MKVTAAICNQRKGIATIAEELIAENVLLINCRTSARLNITSEIRLHQKVSVHNDDNAVMD